MRDHIDFLKTKEYYLIWYAGVLLLALVMYQMVICGVQMIMNGLFESINRNYGLGLRLFTIREAPWAPSLLMGILPLFIVPLLLTNEKKHSNWWVLVELLLFAVVVNLLVGIAPNFVALFICIIVLLLYRMICIHGTGALSMHSMWVMATGALALVAIACVLTALFSGTVREKHNSFLAFEQRLESMIGLGGFSNYSDGYLNNTPPRLSHDVTLTAVVDRPFDGKLFFRGFVGKDYKGNYWGPTNPDAFYAAMKKEKGTKQTVSEKVLGSTYAALSEGSSMGLRKLRLFYPGVADRFSYAPYFTQYSANSNYLRELGDANFMRKSESSSEFSFVSPYSMYENGWVEQKDKRYFKYVKETYLDVPEHLEKTLDDFLGEEIPETVSDKITLVQHQLHAQCSYSLELESLTFSEDFVEHFLNVEHKGFCTHFATAATLLFRRMNVPARYVAGYCAYDEEFEATRDGQFEANVIDDAAHAWTEIYVEHLGWIPIETTPGYADNSMIMEAVQRSEYEQGDANVDRTAGDGSDDNDEQEDIKEATTEVVEKNDQNANASTEQPTESTSENTVAKTDQDTSLRYAILWGSVILGVILFGLLIMLMINLIQARKRHQKDFAKAVIAIRKQMIRKLRRYLLLAQNELTCNKDTIDESKLIANTISKSSLDKAFATVILTEKTQFLRAVELYAKEKNATQYVEYQVAQLLELTSQCYQVLQKLEYSKESLSKDDVMIMNQLFDRLFKGKI